MTFRNLLAYDRMGWTLALCLAWGLMLVACVPRGARERTFRMGERAQVGPLIYSVLETEWRNQLGGSLQARIPQHKYLLVRLTITNAGNREQAVPLLNLVDSSGKSHMELSQGEGVPEWFGLLRVLPPAGTEQGRLLFDVPTGNYRLRITDGGEPETERTALVDLPLRLTDQSPVEPPPLSQQ